MAFSLPLGDLPIINKALMFANIKLSVEMVVFGEIDRLEMLETIILVSVCLQSPCRNIWIKMKRFVFVLFELAWEFKRKPS